MSVYNQKVKTHPSAKVRMTSKILAYFVYRQMMERTLQTELELIEHNINLLLPMPESARALHMTVIEQLHAQLTKELKKTQAYVPRLNKLSKFILKPKV
jgi:hypothetical protein